MRKTRFITRIKGNHRLGKKEYVQGVIVGIQTVLCREEHMEAPWYNMAGDTFIPVTCYAWRYKRLMCAVEDRYPGLCEFNYKRYFNENR